MDKSNELKTALDNFIETDGQMGALRKVSEIYKSQPELIRDKEPLMQLASNSHLTGVTNMTRKLIAKLIQGHIRDAVRVKQTASEILHTITDMEDSSFYTDKSPIFSFNTGNKELSASDQAKIDLIGYLFLEQDLQETRESLGKKWDASTRISFAEETGLNMDDLFSLGRWHTKMAKDCEKTLDSKTAKSLLKNTQRINEILKEKKGHEVIIPTSLYQNAGEEQPEGEFLHHLINGKEDGSAPSL